MIYYMFWSVRSDPNRNNVPMDAFQSRFRADQKSDDFFPQQKL